MCKSCAQHVAQPVENMWHFVPTIHQGGAQNVCNDTTHVNNKRVLPSFFPHISSIQTTTHIDQSHLLQSSFAQFPQGLLLSLLFI